MFKLTGYLYVVISPILEEQINLKIRDNGYT